MNKTLTLEITAVYDKLKSALSSIASLFKDAFDFAKAEIQFRRLLGDFDKAKKIVQELREGGKTGAFGFGELASGMRTLLKYSDGQLGTDTLNSLADFAAATSTPLDAVAKAFGRFYQSLETGGQDFERVVRELENLGVISKDMKVELLDLVAKGAPAVDLWNKVNESLNKFKGVNDEITETTQGKLEKFGNELKDLAIKLVEALIPAISALLPYIEAALPYIKKVGEYIRDYLTDPEKRDWITQEDEPSTKRGLRVERRGPNGQLIVEYVKDKPQLPAAQQALSGVTVGGPSESSGKKKEPKEEAKKAEGYAHAYSEAVKAVSDEYKEQLKKAKDLESALKKLSQTMAQQYAQSLTTTGKIGGYQSQAEQARATANMNPELSELKAQTGILTQIRDQAKREYGLTL